MTKIEGTLPGAEKRRQRIKFWRELQNDFPALFLLKSAIYIPSFSARLTSRVPTSLQVELQGHLKFIHKLIQPKYITESALREAVCDRCPFFYRNTTRSLSCGGLQLSKAPSASFQTIYGVGGFNLQASASMKRPVLEHEKNGTPKRLSPEKIANLRIGVNTLRPLSAEELGNKDRPINTDSSAYVRIKRAHCSQRARIPIGEGRVCIRINTNTSPCQFEKKEGPGLLKYLGGGKKRKRKAYILGLLYPNNQKSS